MLSAFLPLDSALAHRAHELSVEHRECAIGKASYLKKLSGSRLVCLAKLAVTVSYLLQYGLH